MIAQKPRILRVNEFFNTIAPNCPKCGKNNKIRIREWYFVCDRCKQVFTYDEACKGQKEVDE